MNDITEMGLISAILRELSLLEELIHKTPLTDFDLEIIDELNRAKSQFSKMHAKYKESRERANEERVMKIKRAIFDSPLRQYQIAEWVGISEGYLSMIINGHRTLTNELNEKLLNLLQNGN